MDQRSAKTPRAGSANEISSIRPSPSSNRVGGLKPMRSWPGWSRKATARFGKIAQFPRLPITALSPPLTSDSRGRLFSSCSRGRMRKIRATSTFWRRSVTLSCSSSTTHSPLAARCSPLANRACSSHRSGLVPEVVFDGRRRVVIESVSPAVDDGRFPAKRVAGDVVSVEADIFADGHDVLSAVMSHRHQSESRRKETRMTALGNDRWRAELPVTELGLYFFTVEAWVDHFLTWHCDLQKRDPSDLEMQLRIGLEMIRGPGSHAKARDRKRLEHYVAVLEGDDEIADKVHDMRSDELLDLMWRNADRTFATRLDCDYPIEVDRPKAAFSTWYELFPRSLGTFRDPEAQLPRT